MSRRQCPECGAELVLARRSDEQGPGFSARPSNYWRCSICGGEFTAEQVRENKRLKQVEVTTPMTAGSSRMGDEGCPNESSGVSDATGYSQEEEDVNSMIHEEAS